MVDLINIIHIYWKYPIFAIARMAGWGAHRLEELANNGKIIRPGYVSVTPHRRYVPLKARG